MKKTIKIKNTEIKYRIRKSNRAQRLRIAVYCDASVIVTVPRGVDENKTERFIAEKANWIISKLNFFEKFKYRPAAGNSKENYLKYKSAAFELAREKIGYFNKVNGFKFNNINIKNQRTRWGSCSKKGNLNFNYKIALLPEKLADYIIVHELCHLKEFNHSKNFWNLVEKILPDYILLRMELRNKGLGGIY